MDLKQIEATAKRPSRWYSMIQDHVAGDNATTMIKSVSKTLIGEHAGQHYLIPGGRLLVTINRRALKLWDLGMVLESPAPQPTVISELQLSHGPGAGSSIFAVPVVVEDRARFAIVSMGQDTVFRAVEVVPSPIGPVFKQLGVFRLIGTQQASGWQARLRGDWMYVCERNIGFLWNFVRGVWVLSHSTTYARSCSQATKVTAQIIDQFIVHFTEKAIFIWDYSFLDDEAVQFDQAPEAAPFAVLVQHFIENRLDLNDKYRPDMECELPFPSSQLGKCYDIHFLIPSSGKFTLPLVFDVMFVPKDAHSWNTLKSNSFIMRYRLSIGSDGDGRKPNLEKIFTSFTEYTSQRIFRGIPSLVGHVALGHDSMVAVSCSSPDTVADQFFIYANIQTTNGIDEGSGKVKVAKIYENVTRVSGCLAMGRMVGTFENSNGYSMYFEDFC